MESVIYAGLGKAVCSGATLMYSPDETIITMLVASALVVAIDIRRKLK